MLRGFAGRAGIMLSLTAVAATLWLAATGRLGLYINPGYAPFATILAVVGGALALGAFILLPAQHPHEPDQDDLRDMAAQSLGDDRIHVGEGDSAAGPGRLRAAGSLLMVGAAVVGLLVLPPKTLTSTAAGQRNLNVSGTLSRAQTSRLAGQDPAGYTVRDWASLLRYDAAADPKLGGQTATVTGFVTGDRTDPAVFFITRFVVTCCTVDAQPVGVPVYLPGWQRQYRPDQWVTATGRFQQNPHATKDAPVVITADQITETAQPKQPYLTR
ncbi:TIGR03943 family putative permease subunit [Sinomonas atrocyanea]|jgi:uncharacterized repeat protein (TIGR03943 family)|uniref:TIGR03943 family putative permease subunit n=1 Tax=Sinomonas atrocyanea TaxID=37927 RepID=UPI00278313FA|nr:TIGR03943 family protein [Sinomonas atrocyanea]MDQ0261405.1 putative repeat protein (TIGR03943 family) [Sinomonas atrocyanea]MDR6623540.1 putative repeat protein (TIGR03943 family) [Sinomonas atrocyanea]